MQTLRLWEFFVVNVDTALQEFRERFFDAEDPNHDTKATELIIKHISNKRHGMVVDFNSALDVCRSPREDGESDDAYLNRLVANGFLSFHLARVLCLLTYFLACFPQLPTHCGSRNTQHYAPPSPRGGVPPNTLPFSLNQMLRILQEAAGRT